MCYTATQALAVGCESGITDGIISPPRPRRPVFRKFLFLLVFPLSFGFILFHQIFAADFIRPTLSAQSLVWGLWTLWKRWSGVYVSLPIVLGMREREKAIYSIKVLLWNFAAKICFKSFNQSFFVCRFAHQHMKVTMTNPGYLIN